MVSLHNVLRWSELLDISVLGCDTLYPGVCQRLRSVRCFHHLLSKWRHLVSSKFYYQHTSLQVVIIQNTAVSILIKYSWASSRTRWLNAEQSNISKTVSVVVIIMELMRRTHIILEMLFHSPFNHLTSMLA
jgi:hypothetical protein